MDLQTLAKSIFDAQPFSQYIGAELLGVEQQKVTIGINLQPHHFQQHQFVHGGVISYLADNTITFAGGLALQGNALTSEYKINYVKPAQGQKIICESVAESHGSKQAVCTAKIFAINDCEKILCAIAQGTVIKSA